MPADLADLVVAAARGLKPHEALFLPGECVIARSGSGRLRFGCGQIEPLWPRDDAEVLLREHIAGHLDWKTQGYYAGSFRREMELRLNHLDHWVARVEGIGRRNFHVVRNAR